MSIMVTGHRQLVPAGHQGKPWPEGNPVVYEHHRAIVDRLLHFCFDMVNLGHDTFITGMAIGADQLFANAVIMLKNAGHQIRLVAAVPFEGQEGKWPAKSQGAYREIIARCDHVQIICPGAYAPQKMQIRNRWMVDNSDTTLAVWNGAKSGGTWNCLEYARERGNSILRLHPETLAISAE
jgi:uncharacterized phage-like protein YoqJ